MYPPTQQSAHCVILSGAAQPCKSERKNPPLPRSRTPKGRRQAESRHSSWVSSPNASCLQIGCEAVLCKALAPPNPTKNFPQEHPQKAKRTKFTQCKGGCSWGKFSGGQGGLEGRKPSTKEGFLRLQGLPHLTPRKLQPTSGTRRGRNGGQDQDRVTLREPSHRSPICRRGDTCCCGEASSAPERRT